MTQAESTNRDVVETPRSLGCREESWLKCYRLGAIQPSYYGEPMNRKGYREFFVLGAIHLSFAMSCESWYYRFPW